MLQTLGAPSRTTKRTGESEDVSLVDIRHIWTVIRRRWKWIAASSLLLTTLVFGYCLLATPLYTSTATIVIDPRRVQVFGQAKQDSAVVGEAPVDTNLVDSIMATLSSEAVLRRAVAKLNFLEDPEFKGAFKNVFQRTSDEITKIFASSSGPQQSEEQRIRSAIDFIGRRLILQRTGTSFAITLNYTAANPSQASRVLNAVVDSLIEDQQAAAFEVLRTTSDWLESRLKELRERASKDAEAVLSFKSQNKLVDVSGTLVNDQQITQATTQLSTARAQTAEAKARLDRAEEVLRSDSADSGVSEAIRNDVINTLLGRLSDLSRRASDLASRFGENHSAVLAAKNDIRETKRAVNAELRRVAAGIRSDYEVARAREKSLERSIETLIQTTYGSRLQQIKLRDLESAAQSSRALHDSLLQRYDTAIQQQSLPVAPVRVVTRPAQPREKSWPKTPLLVTAALIVGAGLGFAGALTREMFDSTVRTADQLQGLIGTDRVALVPDVPYKDQIWPTGGTGFRRELALDYAVLNLNSRFSESFRRVRHAIDDYTVDDHKIVALVSTLPDEGKTTSAVSLGSLIRSGGGRVLVIDGDLRRQNLSQKANATGKPGLMDALDDLEVLKNSILKGGLAETDFLPAGTTNTLASPGEIILSPNLPLVLNELRKEYDYLLIDLPPLHHTADAMAVAPHVDMFVYVVSWGDTTEAVIRASLDSAPNVSQKIAAAVLNKVPPAALARMYPTRSKYSAADAYYYTS
ncbi:GumC family protein [Methylobacterium iners]|uniref:non-specific protein-tyrosine kinase n=1 Tax=Methylobacterium iners TaxID=418707 RepID=A0ABQ4S4G4_9HYPH|nr:Wzz/FepE/Etk N-terminal domain-containing protein [Methylobacterium iners]GJD98018.1 hypothetical protein OCOJLMKI_5257 [Methylobacterium iners]